MQEEVNHNDFRVDRNNLEHETEIQASLFAYYGESWADAEYERQKCEDRYNVRRGELNIKYRQNPPEIDGKPVKITEDSLRAILDSDDELVRLKAELTEKEHAADVLKTAYRAMDEKGDMVRELNKYAMSQSYSGYQERSNAQAVKEVDDAMQRKLNMRMAD